MTALIYGAEGALGPPFDDVDEAASKGAGCCLDGGLAKAGRPCESHPPVVIGSDIHASGSQPAKAWHLADASLDISGGR